MRLMGGVNFYRNNSAFKILLDKPTDQLDPLLAKEYNLLAPVQPFVFNCSYYFLCTSPFDRILPLALELGIPIPFPQQSTMAAFLEKPILMPIFNPQRHPDFSAYVRSTLQQYLLHRREATIEDQENFQKVLVQFAQQLRPPAQNQRFVGLQALPAHFGLLPDPVVNQQALPMFLKRDAAPQPMHLHPHQPQAGGNQAQVGLGPIQYQPRNAMPHQLPPKTQWNVNLQNAKDATPEESVLYDKLIELLLTNYKSKLSSTTFADAFYTIHAFETLHKNNVLICRHLITQGCNFTRVA